jgi:radical SAM protein with 4Fe4S-binding SPASM domain
LQREQPSIESQGARVRRILRALAGGWGFVRGRPTVAAGPLRVWIEPSAACGMGCQFCPTGRGLVPAGGLLPPGTFMRIAEGLPPRCEVNLHHRGEPLLHPELAAMAGALVSAGHRVRVNTNGMLLEGEARRGLVESGLDVLSLSFDGPDAGRYARLRPGGDYARVVANLKALLAERGEAGPRVVEVELIAFPDLGAPGEVRARTAAVFAPLRPDRIVLRPAHNWGGLDAPASREGKVPPCRRCPHPWTTLAVLADGTVTPCPQDFAGKLRLGNVNETPLAGIWNGPRLRELRAAHAAGRIAGLDPCRNCDVPWRRDRGGAVVRLAVWLFTGGGKRRPRPFLISPKKAARIAALREALPPLGRWLDAATGAGVVARALRDGRRWTYLEAGAAARAAAAGLLVRPVEPAEALDALAAAGFDGVLLSDRLEHVEDDAGILRRCTRLLAPGGRLVITVPWAGRRLYALRRALGKSDAALGHVREGYTPESLAALLRAEGLEVEATRRFAGAVAEISDALMVAAARVVGGGGGRTPLTPPGPAPAAVGLLLRAVLALDRLLGSWPGHGLLVVAGKRGGESDHDGPGTGAARVRGSCR